MQNNDDTTRGQVNPPERDHSLNTARDAAANIIRSDIDRIYSGDEAPYAEAEKEIAAAQIQASTQLPEEKEQPVSPHDTAVHQDIAQDWKQYHTSWQSYYQQYYERYYLNHVHHLKTSTPSSTVEAPSEEDKAVSELHDKLISTVQQQAKTVRRSRHFAPIATAVTFACIFLFLQYNRFLFASVEAYVSPGTIDPQNIVIDQGVNVKVGPEPKLIIPKINVEAPVVYGTNSADNNAVENSLRSGVVHYPIANAASAPGQNGATTILGHSSNDVFDNGQYKFIFVQLSKLEMGDTFFIHYQGIRYTYKVTQKEIISPKEVSKVAGDPTKPSVILITCDPPGTALNRLLVFADQISPDPTKSTKAPSAPKENTPKSDFIGGQGTTFLQNIFGN